MTSSPDLRG